MKAQFGMASAWQAGGAAGTHAVQVIVLIEQSMSVADALPLETLGAVRAAPVARRALAVDGAPAGLTAGFDLPAGFDFIAQRGGPYGERLAAALADAHAATALPMLLIRAAALDVTPDMIEEAARSLVSGEADAAFGPASDGGFWLLGLRRPDRSMVIGIPAPGEDNARGAGRLLRDRLASAGLRVALAPRLEVPGAALRF